jgi:hypothetical protein
MDRMRRVLFVCVVLTVAPAAGVGADEAGCQKNLLKQLLKFERTLVKVYTRCLDLENFEKIPGPCLDATGQTKLDRVDLKVGEKLANSCTSVDLGALGFSTSCADYGSGATGAGAACAGLPASTVAEVVECLQCWKSAELRAYVAVLYASHALEACGGAVDDTSSDCQPLACATPLPEQRALGSSGGDALCQKGVGKAGFKYMLKRTKILSSCALQGTPRADCLADATVQEKLALLETKKATIIQNKCGNINPEPVPAFCCRTGAGNECTAAATREDCVDMGFTVQDDKFCDLDSTCTSLGSDKQFAWWGSCPDDDPCPGTALATTDDLTACVDSVGDRLVDRLLCLQIPRNGGADWPCPGSPSGAFVE